MQNTQSYNEQRKSALVPFVVFCVLLVGMYAYSKSDIAGRPEIRPAETSAPQEQRAQKEPPTGPMAGKQAPDFDLPTLDGKRMKLADLKGKLLFINIWATWCAPCREEMPSMQNLYKQLKGPNFEMIGISIDKDKEVSVAPFVKDLGITFPILFDPESDTAKKYKITGVPETYLVIADGTIIHHLIGPSKWDKPEIVEALKGMIQSADKKEKKN